MAKWLQYNCDALDEKIEESKFQQLMCMFAYAIAMACIFFYFNWVIQKDYTSYPMTRSQNQLRRLLHTDICPYVHGDLKNDKDIAAIKAMLLSYNDPPNVHEKSHYKDLNLEKFPAVTFNMMKGEKEDKKADCKGL